MDDEFLVDLEALAAAPRPPSEVGGKAHGLARLLAAALPVPRGFVLTTASSGDEPAIAERAADLRAPLIVRSSATIEDTIAASAPGIFASLRDVDHDALTGAIRRVQRSAGSQTARSYAELRRLPSDIGMAVIVQEQIGGPIRGTLYTRAVSDPDRLIIELAQSPAWATVDRDSGELVDGDVPLSERQRVALVKLALAAERAIDADAADIEWAFQGEQLWLLQARPLSQDHRPRPPASLFAPLVGDSQTWTWDAAHNPEPLSPAQASLVDRVDRAGLAPYPMRVIGGYLYCGEAEPINGTADTADGLWSFYRQQIVPAIERALLPLEQQENPPLAAALAAHDEVYEIYQRKLGPRLSKAKHALAARLAAAGASDSVARAAALLPAPRAGISHVLDRAARGAIGRADLLTAIGAAAPEWDVASPTFAEAPSLLDRALVARLVRRPGTGESATVPDSITEAYSLTVAASNIAEEDDLYYARAQRLVRRALLGRAQELGLARPDDIFYVTLAEAASATAEQIAERAACARLERERRRRWSMPLIIRSGVPDPRAGGGGGVWRGRGAGGRVTGPVHKIASDTADVPPRSIAVVRAFTPASAIRMQAAAAIVCEHGGLLDHAAAAARELGIPCVVDCLGAYDGLVHGERVTVDGQGGLVVAAR